MTLAIPVNKPPKPPITGPITVSIDPIALTILPKTNMNGPAATAPNANLPINFCVDVSKPVNHFIALLTLSIVLLTASPSVLPIFSASATASSEAMTSTKELKESLITSNVSLSAASPKIAV